MADPSRTPSVPGTPGTPQASGRKASTLTRLVAITVLVSSACGSAPMVPMAADGHATSHSKQRASLPIVAELPVDSAQSGALESIQPQVIIPAPPASLPAAPLDQAFPALPNAPGASEMPGLPAPLIEASSLAPVTTARPPIRIPKPSVPAGPRRVGIQVGHWRNDELPDELRRIESQTGTSGGGVYEWQLNLDVANRVAALLRGHGYAVDILPAAVPPGYLADAFISLHADGDPGGGSRGYKAAHGSRRGPYEGQLVRALLEEYGRATGLPHDADGVTRNMLGYYAFAWSRFQHTVAAHTPSAIFEMGFLTSAADRTVLLQRTDAVATGIANGVLRFFEEVLAGAAFAEDLVVPATQPRPPGLPGVPGQPAPGAPSGPGPSPSNAPAAGARTLG